MTFGTKKKNKKRSTGPRPIRSREGAPPPNWPFSPPRPPSTSAFFPLQKPSRNRLPPPRGDRRRPQHHHRFKTVPISLALSVSLSLLPPPPCSPSSFPLLLPSQFRSPVLLYF